ncbi:alpha/beta hydrolase [Maribacter hydrothermalis]|uniref:Lipase n=1 Tax=Maribacter hydrothermalis TaxID=1836467 RepID=A0A1B7ZCW2_9FLAO|nr:alpha/beta hydrolase [Maribacter hydrothermalis]APQ18699.1 lipase [Maribacter hydrothermalis]OBR40967.1 lipase [Maribacter hydrothermalis]
MKKASIIVFIGCALFFTSCTEDNNTTIEFETDEAISLNNLSYGDNAKQIYDIYLPKNRTQDTKVILLIHGGGWTSGDKIDMNGFKDFIKTELPNIAVVNMNYRFANNTTSPYPMQINDISSLINLLKEKRSAYQISNSIGLIGVSAGGHLGLLWSYAHDNEQQVKMVCSIVGPTNLLDDAYQNSTDPVINDLIGLFGNDEQNLQNASPLYQLNANSPPTILFYGGQDPLIPNAQGVALNTRLTELDVIHEFTFYQNEGHGWVGLNLLDTSIKLKSFIENNLN